MLARTQPIPLRVPIRMALRMVDGSTRWMSYTELGDALGIGSESARQLAIRRRWARQKGNDRKARVAVPEDELRTRTGSDTDSPTDHAPDAKTDVAPDADTVALRVHAAALEVEIRMLRQMFEDMKAERETWKAQAEKLTQALATPAPITVNSPPVTVQVPEPRSWWPWRRSA